ncbi:hypothetical protein FQZ97_893250 [compost metagenome]
MTIFCTEESKGRPPGAPEFLAYSLKTDSSVRLYCRPSFWRWAMVEFDPYAMDVFVNQIVLNLRAKKVSVALQYEASNVAHFVLSRREVSGSDENEILEYADKHAIQCDFLKVRCSSEDQVYADNLLCMLSYINKFKDSLTDRNLDSAFLIAERGQKTIRDAVLNLQDKFPEHASALLFELVRRGRIKVSDVQSKTITGATLIKVCRVRHD